MAAQDHLNSEQYVTVYRGLRDVDHPDDLDPELIGPHWTHDKTIAERFTNKHGSIVTGRVNKKHLMQDSSTGWTHPDLMNDYGMGYNAVYKVFPNEEEKETFVRPEKNIHITHMETSPNNKIREKWQFDPPLVRGSEKLYAYTAKAEDAPEPDWNTDKNDPDYDMKTAYPGDITHWHRGES